MSRKFAIAGLLAAICMAVLPIIWLALPYSRTYVVAKWDDVPTEVPEIVIGLPKRGLVVVRDYHWPRRQFVAYGSADPEAFRSWALAQGQLLEFPATEMASYHISGLDDHESKFYSEGDTLYAVTGVDHTFRYKVTLNTSNEYWECVAVVGGENGTDYPAN